MQKIIEIKTRIDTFELVLNIPKLWDEKKIVIGCHGFDSSKDSEEIVMFGKELEKVGIAYARFTWPYHAERRIDSDDFSVENCLKDLYIVEHEIKRMYPEVKIAIYSTSFGAYLTLLRLKKEEHDFFSIILKSPAIKMDEILKTCLIEEDFKTFKNEGYTIRHRKTPMKVKYNFYEELKDNKIFEMGEYKEKILIFHGKLDDTAPSEDTVEYANNNRNVKLVLLDNESHKINLKKLRKIHIDIAKYIKEI